jgi:LysM repeat protein
MRVIFCKQETRSMTIKKIAHKLFGAVAALAILSSSGMMPATMTASAAALQAAERETIYVVKRGDTLSAIARHYGVTVQAIVAYNGLRSTTIYVGQRLAIPGGHVTPAPVTPTYHVVVRGDTLSALARRYNTTVDALMRLNGLKSSTIYVGQRLVVSGTVPPVPPATPKPPSHEVVYTVVRGDTLSAIARRYGTTVSAIVAANGLKTTTIYVGQRLRIPQGSQPPATPVPGAERIQFAPGAISATVSGQVAPSAPKRYVLRAQRGQLLDVYLETRHEASYIAVLNSWGENMAGAGGPIHQWSGTLPATGDYTVEVRATDSRTAGFRLTVTIPPAPSAPVKETGAAIVESVEIRILESWPVQVHAVLRGYLQDTCTYIENVNLVRESSTFRIRVTTARYSQQQCAQMIVPFEHIVSLDVNGLPSGAYEVRVNDLRTAFKLP